MFLILNQLMKGSWFKGQFDMEEINPLLFSAKASRLSQNQN